MEVRRGAGVILDIDRLANARSSHSGTLEAISDIDEAAGGGVVAVAEKQRVVRSATRETINLADTKSWPTTFRLLGEGRLLCSFDSPSQESTTRQARRADRK
jgi:hypothetical protein